MTKTLRREVTLLDTRDAENLAKLRRGDPTATPLESVTLHPGDEVPSWVDEADLKDDWFNDPIDAAGSNLRDDNIYQVVKQVADEEGVEYGADWSSEQIAAAVRLKRQEQLVADELGEEVVDPMSGDTTDVREAYEDGRSAMAALFDDSNASGNVNAPDQAAPAKASRATKSSGTTGGAQSSST